MHFDSVELISFSFLSLLSMAPFNSSSFIVGLTTFGRILQASARALEG